MGRYLRRTQRKRADGSTTGYLQLAQTSGSAATVLVNLGREDQLDVVDDARLPPGGARPPRR